MKIYSNIIAIKLLLLMTNTMLGQEMEIMLGKNDFVKVQILDFERFEKTKEAVGNLYYDPSYGKKYTSVDNEGDDSSFAEQAVVGYYKQIQRTFNEYNIGNINGDVDVNGEDILESDLQWTVFIFVKRSDWEGIKFN